MSIAADDQPLPRRGHFEKKSSRAAAAMVFKKNVLISKLVTGLN
jgi:hypothetical protein